MKKDNRGYSLVELIVVIAILSIVTTASIIGIRMISGKPADQCASTLKMAFSNHRVSAMGKRYFDPSGNVWTSLTIRVDDSGEIWIDEQIEGVTSSIKACGSGVTIELSNDGINYTVLEAGHSKVFSFDRSTGAFKLGDDIKEIRISKAHKTHVLTLYNLTGKVKLD